MRVLEHLRARNEWAFFAALSRADRPLAGAWWIVLLLRGVLPAVFAIAMGVLVGAVEAGAPLGAPLALMGVVFVLLQILTPLHQAISANLGDRTAACLYDRLTDASVRPDGIGHLEDPALAADLSMSRDFDLGMTGPPLNVSMDFIAGGLIELVGGVSCAVVLAAYAWWAPIVLGGAWMATHWMLRESAVWRDRNTGDVQRAQRDADYAYRLAVDPAPAKELRLFSLAPWPIERFTARRTRLHDLQYQATQLRERPVALSVLLVTAANGMVFWSLARDVQSGAMMLGSLVVFAQSAIGVSMIAFGGLSWALDSAAAPVPTVLRLQSSMALAGGHGRRPADGLPAREIRFRNLTFAYPGGKPILERFDLTIPAGSSLAIVGRNGGGKTTMAKLICRLYDPQEGAIEIDGVDLRELGIESWRSRVTAVFQDFVRFERSLRDNVAPGGAADDVIRSALDSAGASQLAELADAGRTDRSARCRDRARAVRAVCVGGARAAGGRPDHDPGVAPVLDRAHGKPDSGARRRTRRGGGKPPGAHGQAGTLCGVVQHSGRGLPVE